MKHPASKSLSKEETTKIYNLTREIMQEESIAGIPLVFKPKVWKTIYYWKIIPEAREFRVEEKIQFGGKMLTGSSFPKGVYYISLYDPEYNVWKLLVPKNLMLATIVASVILEEIAHAISSRAYGWSKKMKPHGPEFISVFKRLWKEHFIMLQFELQDIYGSEGFLGEELL